MELISSILFPQISDKKKEDSLKNASESEHVATSADPSKLAKPNQLIVDSTLKSDIMLVYEYAHRLNKIVKFEVTDRSLLLAIHSTDASCCN